MNKRKDSLDTSAIVLLASCMALIACERIKEYHYNRFIVGSACEIKYYCQEDISAKKINDEIDSELVRLDSLLNRFSEMSLVSELNRSSRVTAPQDIIELFSFSDSLSQLTGGLFDISVAPLLELWGFYSREFTVPDSIEINKTKGLVDYTRIQIRDDSILISPGMAVDLGGIAQGYAADRVKKVLDAYGIESAIINIGGEIVAIGQSPKGRPWQVGIQNPRGEGIIETVELKDYALSTSGDYEKFFMVDNRRHPHIINPKTGFPALDFVSVTIFADNASYADAMATAVAIMGPDRGIKFLDSLGIHGIIYYEKQGTITRTETQ